jgi:hypothetical protein
MAIHIAGARAAHYPERNRRSEKKKTQQVEGWEGGKKKQRDNKKTDTTQPQ